MSIEMTDLKSQLLTMSPEDLAAMLSDAQATLAAKAKAAAEARTQAIDAFLVDLNLALGDLSVEMRNKAAEHGQQFEIAFDATANQYVAVRKPEPLPAKTVNVSAPRFYVGARAIVNGVEYKDYITAWRELGQVWGGAHPSFNARLELKNRGFEVGPQTR